MNTHFRVLTIGLFTMLFSTLVVADMSDRVQQMKTLLADESRPAADKARDDGRKPAEVIAFLGITPGMQVLDLFASAGYYTEVLSKAVGESGTVYCQNNPRVLEMRGGAAGKALDDRLKDNRLANVQRLDMSVAELALPPASLDAVTFVLNFHDTYNREPQAAVGILKLASRFLKPGGFIGLIDHVGTEGNDNAKLHRANVAAVRKAIADAGLKIAAESDILANPADDHTKMVFDPEIRGHTDRFLFKVVK
jgi:predicted methyltransferase